MGNRLLISLVLLFALSGNVFAQRIDSVNTYIEKVPIFNYDSLKCQMEQTSDSMKSVKILEAQLLGQMFSEHVVRDGQQIINVSRISIFFDNSQNARANAIETLERFKELFPDIPAEMSHENPYFKINVGLCLSTDEVLILLNKLRVEFPKSFIVRERMTVEELKYTLNPELRPKVTEPENAEQNEII